MGSAEPGSARAWTLGTGAFLTAAQRDCGPDAGSHGYPDSRIDSDMALRGGNRRSLDRLSWLRYLHSRALQLADRFLAAPDRRLLQPIGIDLNHLRSRRRGNRRAESRSGDLDPNVDR